MQKNSDLQAPQGFLGEWQWLKSGLLEDRDGILTATLLRLTRIARARGVEPHIIDDVVQETLLEAWSHLERLSSPAGFQPWIDEICRNICRRATHRRKIDLLRHTSLVQRHSEAEQGEALEETGLRASNTPDFLEELSHQDLVRLLDQALGSLPPATRQIMVMCYLLELPRTEVATRLNLSSSALDVRLHRARRHLRQVLSGPLRREAEELGMALGLDEPLAEGWQGTRLWCPHCARHRLQGCFLPADIEMEESNLHLRCPDCYQRYGKDTVHSMGLVPLAGLRSFRPAWKRTMQGLTDRIMQALSQKVYPCMDCGKSALIQVRGGEKETLSSSSPYRFWIYIHCPHCGKEADTSGNIPSVDQLVYWSHPRTRQFLQRHSRWSSMPGKLIEYNGEPAIYFQLSNRESSNNLAVVAHRQTLHTLAIL
ncbi:hypothetical protein KSD_82650 [Ktedonobacter sp. SOSP1-85]|uniref:RNA polymerase sigma factor n=1 Tax=Ktedonobacter sp. SOSP1-85 TaxID=2778367 RepID=UPI0019161827|nr:sigma-70 family RNA polymerase sigma factor [Ktedonobacter sp. SOSP1-85]GHO80494.1 hypothetical protein KSD_82650 [Ktedonobacter sp. SOSP1-85]